MVKKHLFKKFSTEPGVYFFKGPRGKILYIGKAANLKARLASYQNPNNLSAAKKHMVMEAIKIETRPTESEIEALILEASFIKKYHPPYNILMRDDKNYAFAAFTKEPFPKVFITHQAFSAKTKKTKNCQPKAKNSVLIGPFTSVAALKSVLLMLRKAFPYCTCSPPAGGHKRRCVNAEIGKCPGYCCTGKKALLAQHGTTETMARAEYQKNIRAVRAVLTGKHRSLARTLTREMQKLAMARRYEEAAIKRNQIKQLKKIFQHSPYIKTDTITDRAKALRTLKETLRLKNAPVRIEGYDISNIQGKQPVGSMVVFIDGMPRKKEYKRFRIKRVNGANDPAMLHEMLFRRFRHTDWPSPDFILVDGGGAQLNAALSALRSHGIRIAAAGLAKREEKLYIPNKKPIKLASISPHILHLLQHIRDEAHRFAIRYHRKKRQTLLFKQ